jgi:serine/threonine protein kinase
MPIKNRIYKTSVDCGACNASFEVDQLELAETLECPFCQAELVYESTDTAGITRRSVKLDDLRGLWKKTFRPDQNQEETIKPTPAAWKEDAELKMHLREYQVASEEEKDQSSDYVLLDFLGQGGMGVVYQANQVSVNRQLAMKTIRAEMSEKANEKYSFLKEAVVTGNLEHPNIVPVHDLGVTDDGVLFYTMKEIKGKPWSRSIAANSEQQNINILLEVCDAIAYAHQKGIIHRDIKPENVMLGDFGEVMVTDWGLAACYLQRTTIKYIPTIFERVDKGGTPAYMSPEMAICEHTKLGPASDIYLLGGILYEIMSGKRPHAGRDIYNCIYAAMENIIQASEKKNEFIDIALKAMAYYPEDRFSSVKEFQQAIRNCLQHAESIEFSDMAMEDYYRAKKTGDYDDFSQALLGFKEALKLWEDNDAAHIGLRKATYAYAKRAFKGEDLDLAESVLDPRYEEHLDLMGKIESAKNRKLKREKRGRFLTYLLGFLLIAIVIIILISIIRIKIEEVKTRSAYLDAKKAEESATQLLQKVEQERDRAKNAEKELRKMVTEYRQEKRKAEKSLIEISNLQNVVDKTQQKTNVVQKDLYDKEQVIMKLQRKWYNVALGFLKNKNLGNAVDALKNSGDYDPEDLKQIILRARTKYGKKLDDNEIFAIVYDSRMKKYLLKLFLNNKVYNSALYDQLKKIEFQENVKKQNAFLSFGINTLNFSDVSVKVIGDDVLGTNDGRLAKRVSFSLKLLDDLPLHRLTLKNLRIRNLDVLNDSYLRELKIINCIISKNGKAGYGRISFPFVKELVLVKSLPVNNMSFDAPSLKKADFSYTDLKSLDIIKGSELESLNISYTQIDDLKPLKDMPLEKLYLSGCFKITDIRPILSLDSLKKIVVPKTLPNITLLKSMNSLKYISTDSLGGQAKLKKAKQFWREYDILHKKD